jgi:hypothetical protein
MKLRRHISGTQTVTLINYHHGDDSSDDGGSMHLWNTGKRLPDCQAHHPRRQSSSYTPTWKPEISLIQASRGVWSRVATTVQVCQLDKNYIEMVNSILLRDPPRRTDLPLSTIHPIVLFIWGRSPFCTLGTVERRNWRLIIHLINWEISARNGCPL